MKINYDIKVTSNFDLHYKAKKKIVISQGGGRSGKTYAILQLLILKALTEKNQIISVVAENIPFLKRGAISDFKLIMKAANIWNEKSYNKTDNYYTFHTGSIIQFFSVENYGRALGAARDYLFINEANNVAYETAFQLIARTKKQIYLDFNPVDEFWAHTEIMNLSEFKGQYDFLITTFLGNEKLDDSIKTMMLARAARDPNYKRVYIDGLIGKIEGLIFPNFKLIDKIPDDVVVKNMQYMGVDWGWSNDPSTINNVYITSTPDQYVANIYIDELFYQTKTHNREISDIIKKNIEKINYEVIADSAEPKSIDEIFNYGINIFPADKPAGSVNFGIELIQQANIFITKNSVNTIKEFRNYRWAKDKNGKTVKNTKGKPVPVDNWNHSIDGIRYVAIHHMNKNFEYTDVDKNAYEDNGWMAI